MAKQKYMEGMEPPSIPALDEAAEDYRKKRDARMRMGEKESDAQDNLIAVMREHKVETYIYDDFKVFIDVKEKAKVKRKKDRSADNGDGDEDE